MVPHTVQIQSHFHNQLFPICSQNEKINMWKSDAQTNSNDDQGLTENSVTEQEVLKCKYAFIYSYSTNTVPTFTNLCRLLYS